MTIIFNEEHQLWWPEHDTKIRAIDFIYKQAKNIDLAIGHCRQTRTVIQAGGHIGIWPKNLSGKFQKVMTFEPSKPNNMCLRMNIKDCPNVTISNDALGSTLRLQTFFEEGNSQKSSLIEREGKANQSYLITIIPIDSYDLDNVDLIILDTEGTEEDILIGARNTILRCSPVIMLENWNDRNLKSEEYIKSLGYIKVERANKDNIFIRT